MARCRTTFIAVIHKWGKQPECALMDKQKNKMCYNRIYIYIENRILFRIFEKEGNSDIRYNRG